MIGFGVVDDGVVGVYCYWCEVEGIDDGLYLVWWLVGG